MFRFGNRAFFLTSLFLLASCASYIRSLSEDRRLEVAQEKNFYCSKEDINPKDDFILLGSTPRSTRKFHQFLNSLKAQYHLNRQEIIALWALAQMGMRPDIASPSARLSFIFSKKGQKPLFYDYTSDKKSKTRSYPFFQGLEQWLKENKSSDIRRLLTLLSRFEAGLSINKDFSIFLKENDSELIKNLEFKNAFYRSDQILREGESAPVPQFKGLMAKLDISKNSVVENKATFIQKNDLGKVICNVDITNQKNDHFEKQVETPPGHVFGVSFSDGTFFLAAVAQNLGSTFKNLIPEYFLFAGTPAQRPVALCLLESNNHAHQLSLVSFGHHHPLQILLQTLNQPWDNVTSASSLQELLASPRYLWMDDPLRLLVEVSELPEDKKSALYSQWFKAHKSDAPIYFAESIGKLWGHFQDKNDWQNSTFVTDSRFEGGLSCWK